MTTTRHAYGIRRTVLYVVSCVLLTQHNQENARMSPDPFPFCGWGLGTRLRYDTLSNDKGGLVHARPNYSARGGATTVRPRTVIIACQRHVTRCGTLMHPRGNAIVRQLRRPRFSPSLSQRYTAFYSASYRDVLDSSCTRQTVSIR